MNNRTLHIVLASIAIIWALWLPVHRFLVVKYDANPWKGAGMAMYTNPHSFDMNLDFYLDGIQIDIQSGDFTNSAKRDVNKFRVFRKHMGSMIKPDKLAYRLLEESRADMMILSIQLGRLNTGTGKFEIERETFTFHESNAPKSVAAPEQ